MVLALLFPLFLKKQSEFLEKIKNWGFIINPLSKAVNGIEEIEKNIRKLSLLDHR